MQGISGQAINLIYIAGFGWDLTSCQLVQSYAMNYRLFVQRDSIQSFNEAVPKMNSFLGLFGGNWRNLSPNSTILGNFPPGPFTTNWNNDLHLVWTYTGNVFDLSSLTRDLQYLSDLVTIVGTSGYIFSNLETCNGLGGSNSSSSLVSSSKLRVNFWTQKSKGIYFSLILGFYFFDLRFTFSFRTSISYQKILNATGMQSKPALEFQDHFCLASLGDRRIQLVLS